MPHSIQGRAAYTGSRNVADVSNDAQAIPDVPPPPPPSSYHRNISPQLRAAPTAQRADVAAENTSPNSEANPMHSALPPTALGAVSSAEANDEVATITNLRRRWPAWLTSIRWPKRLSALPGRALLRAKRQWVIGVSIAVVAAFLGWSIGAKPWSHWSKPKPVAASAQVKGRNLAKSSQAANAAKPTDLASSRSPKFASTTKTSATSARAALGVTGKSLGTSQKVHGIKGKSAAKAQKAVAKSPSKSTGASKSVTPRKAGRAGSS